MKIINYIAGFQGTNLEQQGTSHAYESLVHDKKVIDSDLCFYSFLQWAHATMYKFARTLNKAKNTCEMAEPYLNYYLQNTIQQSCMYISNENIVCIIT